MLRVHMKKSAAVTLIISGAILAGCDDRPNQYADWSSYSGTNGPITNNTYWPGHGYWHAPYYDWYPYPYNYYRPGFGYYYGGRYWDRPDANPIASSVPPRSSFSGSRFSSGTGGSSGEHSSVSRGGFGGSGRSGLS